MSATAPVADQAVDIAIAAPALPDRQSEGTPASDMIAALASAIELPGEMQTPAIAEVVILNAGRTNGLMLASRIASQRALNPPKALARKRTRATSTTKPLPKRPGAPVQAGPKPKRQVNAPRVLMPIPRSAEIIRLSERTAGMASITQRSAA